MVMADKKIAQIQYKQPQISTRRKKTIYLSNCILFKNITNLKAFLKVYTGTYA